MTNIRKPFIDLQIIGSSRAGEADDGTTQRIIQPASEPAPLHIEDEDLRDIAYISSTFEMTETTEPIPFNTVLINELGGNFDTGGVDVTIPFRWQAAENGWYRIQLAERYAVSSIDSFAAPLDVRIIDSFPGGWDDSTTGTVNQVFTIAIPTGFEGDYYATRTLTRYYALQTGQKIGFHKNVSFEQTPGDGEGNPLVDMSAQSSVEIVKVGAYTP